MWQWLDLERGEAVALPALDGLGRERTSGVTAWPRWLLLRSDLWPGYDPLVGLDMDTGETAQLVELMQGPDKVSTSADGRFAVLGTDWEDTTPARLVDVATGVVTPLSAARTQMVRSGVVSPDGSRAAIHAVANADHALEVLLIDTADPAAMQPLSPGAAALWTGELSNAAAHGIDDSGVVVDDAAGGTDAATAARWASAQVIQHDVCSGPWLTPDIVAP